MDKLIITAALVGAEVTKKDNPSLPVTPDEIAEDARKACLKGASIAHIHVRDKLGLPTQNKEIYKETIDKIQKRCDIIVQVSTGGAVGMSDDERMQPLELSPPMGTLTTGTVNFGKGVFQNSPQQIEVFAKKFMKYNVHPEFEIFDKGMIQNALNLINKELVKCHSHFDFVLGVPGGIPSSPENLIHLKNLIPDDASWSVAAVGRHQLPMTTLGIVLGGHVRVGLEDNIYYTKGELATNTMLVERAVRLSKELGREVATPSEARKILKLPQPVPH